MDGGNSKRSTKKSSARSSQRSQPTNHLVGVTILQYGTDILKFDFQPDEVIHTKQVFVPLNISPEDFMSELEVCLRETLPNYSGDWLPFCKPSDLIRTIVKMTVLDMDEKAMSVGAVIRMVGHVFVVLLDPPNSCGSLLDGRQRPDYLHLLDTALSNVPLSQKIVPSESKSSKRDSKKVIKSSTSHFRRDAPMLPTTNSARKLSALQHGDTELFSDVKSTASSKRKYSDFKPASLNNLAEELDQPMSISDSYSYVVDEVNRRHLQLRKNRSRR